MPRRFDFHILLALTMLAAIVAGCTQRPQYEQDRVVAVVDGDTVDLASGERARLLGINTPERGTLYYEAATQRLAELVLNRTVQLEPGYEHTDQYDRLLRYVYINDTMVNAQLVQDGLATTYFYRQDVKHAQVLRQAERTAQKQGHGLWDRSPSHDCLRTAIHPNAEGNDNANLNGEYVRFTNVCDYSLDVSGWTVKDAGTNTYTFHDRTLDSDGTVTLRTGTGTDTATAAYWGRGHTAVWNNDGDRVFLRDRNGLLVAHRQYSAR